VTHVRRLLLAGLACALPLAVAAQAPQRVTIGLSAPPASFDPHFYNHIPSAAVQLHVFERLVGRDAEARLVPELALRWEMLPDSAGWDFHLDPAARFSDGQKVTAADVAASIARVPTVPNSPQRYLSAVQPVRAVEAASEHTVRLLTNGPAPLLAEAISQVMVVPARIAADAATPDFNAGHAAIGSGPFRLVQYVQGERIVLDHNPGWRGRPVPFAGVTLRVIAADASRLAALRAGDVDLIEAVPTRDAAALARDPSIAVWRGPGSLLLYVMLDVARARAPGVSDLAGRPLDRNPLQDARVRRALSLAIDREAIRLSVMDGLSVPAGQIQAIGYGAADPGLRPDPYDPARARALLAEAGWADGFRLVFAGPTDRYANDDKVLQAIAQYWERIGVRVQVEALPSSVYFPRLAQRAFPAAISGWGAWAPEPVTPVAALLLSEDRGRGWGAANRSGYSNPLLDALYPRIVTTLDAAERKGLWQQAMRIAMADAPILPIHHQVSVWATRRGLAYEARADGYTLAMSLRPAP
jgi:peptide/nickel transport system substrate-binding protein